MMDFEIREAVTVNFTLRGMVHLLLRTEGPEKAAQYVAVWAESTKRKAPPRGFGEAAVMMDENERWNECVDTVALGLLKMIDTERKNEHAGRIEGDARSGAEK